MEPLLQVRGLRTWFYTEDGVAKAVDGVDFEIDRERTLGVVGESGCGKSVTALSIMGLVRDPPGRIVAGEILYHRPEGVLDLARQDPRGPTMRTIRGNEIAMIFQEPMTSLNPVYTIGNQIVEAIVLHQKRKPREAKAQAVEMLRAVGISNPERRVDSFPHELSGGMRQRAMVAMALSCNPRLLIADEPTTALDVTIQAQVIELMAELRVKFHASLMFITHDLGIVANIADDVAVMYLGKIVEKGPVRAIFHDPKHPYTLGLMNSIPAINSERGKRLVPIEGVVPSPWDIPAGCVFAARCPRVMDRCLLSLPELVEVSSEHRVACWLHAALPAGAKA
ncbi:MAG: ABC transporter ATP-binding protein [Spirochaetota bacterium]